MAYQVPDNDNERLAQLNDTFNQLICSEEYFEDDKWILIRFNLDKWRKAGYELAFQTPKSNNVFNNEELVFTLRLYNLISEIQLFQYNMKECAKNQEFEQAANYRDMTKSYKNILNQVSGTRPSLLVYFEFKQGKLGMKFIENFFVTQYVKDRFRIA